MTVLVACVPDEGDTTTPSRTSGEYVFGMLLVGPYNDHGWSQAHYEGAKYAESKIPGTRFLYIDKVNPSDRPNVTVEQLVDDLVAQGAKFIAAYLGARYCAENLRDEPFTSDMRFEVVWIGFWFHIPGITLDPTRVANDFINSGSDVVLSGIDTTEALIEAQKATKAGERVYAIPYDYQGACSQGPDVCLGVPYFNWGPPYTRHLREARAGTWKQAWEWQEPDWSNLNNPDTSPIGFTFGPALSEANRAKLDTFIQGLADGSIKLFVGPLHFQDGTVYLAEGEEATDQQIWYTPQLLEGIEGQSAAN